MSTDLVAWLLEQIAEDERGALAGWFGYEAEGPLPDGARWVNSYHQVRESTDEKRRGGRQVAATAGVADIHHARHIARWNPARVLAECDAKRRIIGEHRTRDSVHLVEAGAPVPVFSDPSCRGCGFGGDEEPRTEHVNECPTLRALALPYADRPGYREEWRP